MIPDGQFSGTWKSGGHTVKISLPLIIFEEAGSQIAYCPALDVSGYGEDESQAIESFQVCLGEFLLYTVHKNTLYSELLKLGWKVRKSGKKPMTPPPLSQLLDSNDNFSRIFNNFPFRKIDETIELPA